MSSSDSALGQRHNGSHTFGQRDIRPRNRMRVRHDPANGHYGDCFRCCVATMLHLDAEEVPHVFENGEDGPTGHGRMDEWLKARGLCAISTAYSGETPLDTVLKSVAVYNPGVPHMIGGMSRPGIGHFVVAQDGRVICDPAAGTGLSAPYEDDNLWFVWFIGAAVVLDRLAGGVKLPETGGTPPVDSQSPSPAQPNGLAPNPSGHPL